MTITAYVQENALLVKYGSTSQRCECGDAQAVASAKLGIMSSEVNLCAPCLRAAEKGVAYYDEQDVPHPVTVVYLG